MPPAGNLLKIVVHVLPRLKLGHKRWKSKLIRCLCRVLGGGLLHPQLVDVLVGRDPKSVLALRTSGGAGTYIYYTPRWCYQLVCFVYHRGNEGGRLKFILFVWLHNCLTAGCSRCNVEHCSSMLSPRLLVLTQALTYLPPKVVWMCNIETSKRPLGNSLAPNCFNLLRIWLWRRFKYGEIFKLYRFQQKRSVFFKWFSLLSAIFFSRGWLRGCVVILLLSKRHWKHGL